LVSCLLLRTISCKLDGAVISSSSSGVALNLFNPSPSSVGTLVSCLGFNNSLAVISLGIKSCTI
jgi:hypothetical protein